MGKLQAFFLKIKGMFNRNKALPEWKNSEYEVSYVDNMIKETNEETMSTHDKFVDELQKQANDLTKPPVEDAILKALEEKGLNSKLSENPEFKKQMYTIFGSLAYDNGDMKDPDVFVKNLRDAISDGAINDYHFNITADGKFEYNKENDGTSMVNPSLSKSFTVDKNGTLTIVSNKKSEYYKENDEKGNWAPENFEIYTKKQETFDKNGLQTNISLSEYTKSDKQAYISSSAHIVSRNQNLVTAKYTAYASSPLNLIQIQSKEPNHYYSHNIEQESIMIDTIGKDAELLNYVPLNYTQLAEHTTVKEEFDEEYINKRLNEASQKSSLIKSLAEQRGLIEKEESSMEQE